MNERASELIQKYVDGALSDDEIAELEACITASEAVAESFALATRMHDQLASILRESADVRDTTSLLQQIEQGDRPVPTTASAGAHRMSVRPLATWGAVAAAIVIAIGGVAIWWSGSSPAGNESKVADASHSRASEQQPKSADRLIVLASVEQSGASEPMLPFTFEAEADVVAIAVMGQSEPRGGRQVIRLELVEVLKGKQQAGPLESADGLVPFGCIMPKDPKQFSDMYRAGERVAVYLKKSDQGWSTLQMNHLTAAREPAWKARVQPFLDVLLASKAEDPKRRYAEVLAGRSNRKPSDKSVAGANLSQTAYYALSHNPDPNAAPAVREMLFASLDARLEPARPTEQNFSTMLKRFEKQAIDGEILPHGTNLVDGVTFQDRIAPHLNALGKLVPSDRERATFPNTPHALASLLARMHDAQSVRPVVVYIWLLEHQPDQRLRFVQLLPELCHDADADTLRWVQLSLVQLTAAYQGDKQHAHYRTLQQTQASIQYLLERALKGDQQ